MPEIEFSFKNNVPLVEEALANAKAQALEAMGITAEKFAKENVPPRANTGFLSVVNKSDTQQSA